MLDSFDQRQLRLLVTAVSAQRLFWAQQETLAHTAQDAELGAMATRYIRDHDEILRQLRSQLGAAVAVDTLTVPVPDRNNVQRRNV
ncbi:MAG TPA: hypothetical protein VGO08_20565 [Burkholderiales bacterium]|nr:hypothetical protein [Burkholderiales bacterium]